MQNFTCPVNGNSQQHLDSKQNMTSPGSFAMQFVRVQYLRQHEKFLLLMFTQIGVLLKPHPFLLSSTRLTAQGSVNDLQ